MIILSFPTPKILMNETELNYPTFYKAIALHSEFMESYTELIDITWDGGTALFRSGSNSAITDEQPTIEFFMDGEEMYEYANLADLWYTRLDRLGAQAFVIGKL